MITMKLLLSLSTALTLASSAFAGYSTVWVNGQAYTVYHADNSPYTTVTGPDGYNATGYRWSNGNQDWTVNSRGTSQHCDRNGW
jgi:hypothetical protein